MLNPHLLLLLAPGAVVATERAMTTMEQSPEPESLRSLLNARRLVVWLQRLDEVQVDQADPDVLVIDYSRDGSEAGERTMIEVERLRRRPAGGKRIVLAYLSIGEAEDYRFYWKDLLERRSLLGPANRRWRGNYLVRYWDPAWHDIIYRVPRSYLRRIVAQGFDGVFLDTVDAADRWEASGVKDAPARMAALVRAIAQSARARHPGFLVVAQNPYRILGEPGVMDAISGVSAEAYLFPEGREASSRVRDQILGTLRKVRALGRAVLVIEYPRSASQKKRLSALCREHGFLCFAGSSLLDGPGFVISDDSP